MKFLHISDLHLGKRVNGFSMLEDQRYILNRILDIAESRKADGVIIAGDVYDRQVPPAEAVALFDKFLTGLAGMGKKVFVVSGNHDSAERLSFGARLMQGREVYVSPVYDGNVSPIRLTDEFGELFVYLLPFVKPAAVRHALEPEETRTENMPDEETRTENGPDGKTWTEAGETEESGAEAGKAPASFQEAVQLAVERMEVDESKRNLLVAHQFVTGAGRCDSEEISVGGLDNVEAAVFDGFDYVALGHIHSPQWIKRDSLRYSGTPLKYSFSEAEQEKSVTVVEMREKGRVEISVIPLKGIRDMRKIRGTYLEVMAKSAYREGGREDYVQVTLTDEEDIPDGFAKLRTVYPNLMQVLYDNSRTRESRVVEGVKNIEKKSELTLFEEFYELQNNRPMSDVQRDFVKTMIENLKESAGGGNP